VLDQFFVSLVFISLARPIGGDDRSGGPASWGGKAKTILQFASLLLLLWPNGWGAALKGENSFGLPGLLHLTGYWLFWPSLLLALSSAWGYLKRR
jgi:CDP-diacylglycerol--glycerol-3-phosphate 3-phosphatidyltransferase